MRAILIPADVQSPVQVVHVHPGEDLQCRTMAEVIDAEYTERVVCALTPEHSLVLVVDEVGRISTPPKPFNPRADRFYATGGVRGIHGDVLVAAEGWTEDGIDYVDLADPSATLALVNSWDRT